jgi:diguanylate cyclase
MPDGTSHVGGSVSVPPDDIAATRFARRRRARTNVLGMIAASYALDTIILLLYEVSGTIPVSVPLTYALAAALVCAVFFMLYRSRLRGDDADPFFTIVQTVPSVVVQLTFLILVPEVGFVFLTVLFIVFGIAAMRLTLAQAALGWGLTALGVAVVVPLLGGHPAIPVNTPAERWISWLCFVLTLGRCVGIGLLGSRYRQQLGQRTEALRLLNATLEDQVALRTRELAHANEELERVVAQQTTEIKTLRGILPICSHCKKIRDDRGSWNQLEAYISERTEILFSHGLCSDCRRRFYPEFPGENAE